MEDDVKKVKKVSRETFTATWLHANLLAGQTSLAVSWLSLVAKYTGKFSFS